MKLLWLFPAVSRLALGIYYRMETTGGRVPETGPVLLVANHPNSLLDPAAVCAVAGRPVRFLAKAPLFSDPVTGWLMRACGAIPVYQRKDDPALMARNEEMFREVHGALTEDQAVGIFPEGLTHSEPSLTQLKTGAARIALGAASILGSAFPIVPVGLVLREKARFRSRALTVIGDPVPWADVAGADADDQLAVRKLTDRIEAGLRTVTLNLEHWEDAPVVDCAETIYAAEFNLPEESPERLRRLRQISEGLTRLRRKDPQRLEPLYRAISRYAELLAALQLRPQEIERAPPRGAVARWIGRQLAFLALLAPLGALGALIFYVPHLVTRSLSTRARVPKARESTVRVLGGFVVYGTWILLPAGLIALLVGVRTGVLVLLGLPALGFLTIATLDRWEDARATAGSYLLLRHRGQLRERLREQRHDLAGRLERLRVEILVGT